MSTFPKYLYHGTRAEHLPTILRDNLRPRRDTGISQWEHTVASREDAVYLSTAYPLYYAIHAQAQGDLLVLEIDTDYLKPSALVADEDALAHCLRRPETAGMNLHERTLYYRERMSDYSAEYSLGRLGTCAHLGAVPKEAVKRAVRISSEHIGLLVLGGFDPVIHPVNYEIHGADYNESVRWLFRDVDVCAINPRMPDIPRDVIQVHTYE